MTTEEHLEKIKAKCLANLALAEKRTQGKWKDTGTSIKAGKYQSWYSIKYGDDSFLSDNAAFIAACAGSAESGWRSTIAAIDGLIELVDYIAVTARDFQNKKIAHEMASNILSAWSESLL